MTIRAAAPTDHAAIRELLVAAFPGPDEARLVARLRADGAAAIELVAEQGGETVGHILFSPLEAPFRALALAPVAVAPERQRTGIGSELIAAAHGIARDQGWTAIFVLGDPAYYRRFGFDPALATGFASPYAGSYFMALALDGELPTRTGRVKHAAAFASLA
jgi:putative acetyltransferase